jgi:hypothetical protein
MNLSNRIQEDIELLQNRRQLALKSKQDSQFAYGRVTAFNECLATLKDLKKSIEAYENNNEIDKMIKKEPLAVKNIQKTKPVLQENHLQVV